MNLVVTISVLTGIVAYSAFFIFCLVNLLRGVTGRALLIAASFSLIWMISPLLPVTPNFYAMMEAAVTAAWLLLLIRALGVELTQEQFAEVRPVRWLFATAIGLAGAVFAGNLVTLFRAPDIGLGLPGHLSMVSVNVLGLVLVEQLARNSVPDYRWRLRYLNIGLSLLFGFGLAYHALAIFFGGPVPVLVVLQPAVMALVTPFIVIASLRNSANQLRFSLSRNFIFRTGVLMSTGLFLFLLGLFGYLAQLFAGELGTTVAVFVTIAALTALLVVLGSSRFRSRLRVILSKTFFEYRYDYREEWIKVTAQLTEPHPDFDLAQQAQRAILSILHAKQAGLWALGEDGSLRPISNIEAPEWQQPIPASLSHAIADFYLDSEWVLELDKLPASAADIASSRADFPPAMEARYLIPLVVESRLFGVCMTGAAEIPLHLAWEDYDIIKLISKQCAGFLALQATTQSLIEADQLAAVNQMSAFLLHDIKTIAAQLSLMLQNAPKHRDNPAFIDDMLSTTQNSLTRMERIIAGLREAEVSDESRTSSVNLTTWINARRQRNQALESRIGYQLCDEAVVVMADLDALDTAMTHLEQNALEALGENGHVTVKLGRDATWGVLQVIDTGAGMDEAFIKHELFTPFRSTKGLTGMGIGAFQARDKIRQCGGDLQVESKVGVGTTFTIKLPLSP